MSPPPRLATVVLQLPDGGLGGVLPELPVATPCWQDVAPVVRAVREAYGIEVVVLRLLEIAVTPQAARVTYLAETQAPCPAASLWAGVLDDHPLRNAYARPGGRRPISPGPARCWPSAA